MPIEQVSVFYVNEIKNSLHNPCKRHNDIGDNLSLLNALDIAS